MEEPVSPSERICGALFLDFTDEPEKSSDIPPPFWPSSPALFAPPTSKPKMDCLSCRGEACLDSSPCSRAMPLMGEPSLRFFGACLTDWTLPLPLMNSPGRS